MNRAVVVGIDRYDGSAGLSPLRFAASDARKISQALASSGWQRDKIQLLATDESISSAGPTKQAILAAVQAAALGDSVHSDDSVFIVFAGHGFSRGRESYICPEDFDRARPVESALGIAEIAALLRRSPARVKAVVIDACRDTLNGEELAEFDLLAALRADLGSADAANVSHGGKGTVFFSSCMPGEQSYEDARSPVQGGVFLHFFSEALAGYGDFDGGSHDGVVTAPEAIAYASRKTRDHVRARGDASQTPWADCSADTAIALAKLDVAALENFRERFGTQLAVSLRGARRLQAESMIDSSLGPLATGDRPLTVRFATAAIDSDGEYALARRVRSLMYQLAGNDEPSKARKFYRDAIDDMRAVQGSLRVKLIEDQDIETARREKIVVPTASVVLIDEIVTVNDVDLLHVHGFRGAVTDPLIPAQSINGYLRLDKIAVAASNAAQLEEFYRSLELRNPRWALRLAGLLANAAAFGNNERPRTTPSKEIRLAKKEDLADLAIVTDRGTRIEHSNALQRAAGITETWEFFPAEKKVILRSKEGPVVTTYTMNVDNVGRFSGIAELVFVDAN
ncbi:MAG: caspase domain-containing protein, partial [Planctomycetota bacterium]